MTRATSKSLDVALPGLTARLSRRPGPNHNAQWLALRLRTGEPAAVARLYEQYAGAIYAIANDRLGARAKAEDVMRVVHAVFARCCREIRPEMCLPDQFAPWLMTITVRGVASALGRLGGAAR
jgi:hypothetical protein